MRLAKWLGVALIVCPLPAAAAHSATARDSHPAPNATCAKRVGTCLYRFSLAGTPALVVTWTVTPANAESLKGVFLVLSGSACGTDPLTARWKLIRQASTSGSVQTRLAVNFRSANPYPIYVGSYPNAGSITAKLRLTSGLAPKVSLVVKATPSFSKITFLPKTALVVARLVKSCP